MGWAEWAQLLGLVGGGATVALVIRQLIELVKFVLKRRTLNRVIEKSESPDSWIAASKALQKIDSRPPSAEAKGSPSDAGPSTAPPQLPQRNDAQERAPTAPEEDDRPPTERPVAE